MVAEKVMSSFEQIENEIGTKAAEILSQLFNISVSAKVEAIDTPTPENLISIVGETALFAQVTRVNSPHRIIFLAEPNALPAVVKDLSENKNAAESQAITQATKALAKIFAEISADMTKRTGQNIQFSNPQVQLKKIADLDEFLSNSNLVVFAIQADQNLQMKICKLIPNELVELMLTQPSDTSGENVVVESHSFEQLKDKGSMSLGRNLDSLFDLELPITVELGRVKMQLKDILELGPGGIIELNKFSGEPVDLFVNSKKFAEGEVVLIDQNFGVRITGLVSQRDRFATVGKKQAVA